MQDLLSKIELISWIFDLLTLLILFKFARENKGVNSSLLTMTVILVAGSLMIAYEKLLTSCIENFPTYMSIINFFWFVGFAAFYVASIRAIRLLHNMFHLKIGILGKYISFSFYLIGSLQVFLYSEILLFKTDIYIGTLYDLGVPGINIANTIVCFSFAILAAYLLVKQQKGPKDIKWVI